VSVAIISGSAGLVGSETVAYFAAKGMEVVGIDNGMRKEFFGEEASTAWMRNRLQREIRSYRHYDVDIRNQQKFRPFSSDIETISAWSCILLPSLRMTGQRATQ
jgi:CDP-paratose 2-epimerase